MQDIITSYYLRKVIPDGITFSGIELAGRTRRLQIRARNMLRPAVTLSVSIA